MQTRLRGEGRVSPVSQSQSRQLLSAEPVSTCRVSPRSPVKEYQYVLSSKKLLNSQRIFICKIKKPHYAEIGQVPFQDQQHSSTDRARVLPLQNHQLSS